ncbi:MAG: PEP-CTERM sorting domain-containing protein [Armatimonadia bacterium]
MMWQTETLPTDVPNVSYLSFALGAGDQPWIAYYKGSSQDLMCATYDGASWQSSAADSAGWVGKYNSIVLDALNRPQVSYFEERNSSGTTTYDLKYATYDGSSWSRQTVDTGGSNEVGPYTSIALDSLGRAHIAYYDRTNGDLKYAHFDGTTWQVEQVDTVGDVGRYASLRLDAYDRPHVSYYDATNTNLKYAMKTATGWEIETVDGQSPTNTLVGQHTSLALDSANRAHITYWAETGQDLRYAYEDETGWHAQTVDGSPTNDGWYSSLELDSSGLPCVSYYSVPTTGGVGKLKFAAWNGTSWDVQVVDAPSGKSVGYYSALELLNGTTPRIAYLDATSGAAKYAQASVPEPATGICLALGLVGLGLWLKSRRKSADLSDN